MSSRLRGVDIFDSEDTQGEPYEAQFGPASPAQQALTVLYEQDQRQRQNGQRASEQAPDLPTKGKPRLLLMGQRRYVVQIYVLDSWSNIIAGVASPR